MDKVKEVTDIMLEKYGKDGTIAYLQGMLQLVMSLSCRADYDYILRTIERHIKEEEGNVS
jgi:hypothetical protein